jgi:hypothetical protein
MYQRFFLFSFPSIPGFPIPSSPDPFPAPFQIYITTQKILENPKQAGAIAVVALSIVLFGI